jgi:hypothetical protein
MASEYDDNAPIGAEVSRVDSVAVGTSVVTVSAANRRSMFILRNSSSAGQIISITLSNNINAATGSGIVLNAGDSYAESNSEGFKTWSGKITAIASAASGTLAITERA